MNIFALSGLINAISVSILGGFVYIKNKSSEINRRYALFCFFVAFWSYNYFFWQIAKDAKTALFFSRSLMAGAIFIPICFLHFVLILLNLVEQKKKNLIFGYFIFSVFFILNFTHYFVKGVAPKLFFPFWPEAGIVFGPFLVIWLWYCLYPCLLLYKGYHLTSGMKRNQLKYVLLGITIGYTSGSTNYFLWYDIPIAPYGNFIVPLFVSIMAYAVIKYKLMGIKVAIKTVAIPIFSLSILVCIVALSFRLFPTLSTQNSVLITLSFIFSGIFIYSLLHNRIGLLINKLFPPRDYSSLLNGFKNKAGKFYSVIEVSDLTINTIQQSKEVESASLFLQDKTKENYLVSSSFGLANPSLKLTRDSALVNFFRNKNNEHKIKIDTLIKDELPKVLSDSDSLPIIQDMDRLKAQVVMPLIDKEELVGILSIGNNLSGDVYDNEDYTFFRELSERATVNIVDAQLREEAEAVRAEQEHLARLSTMGEMTAAMAHEIDNPNYIVIGQAGLIKHKLNQKDLNDKVITELKSKCDWIVKSAFRISEMINRILDFSKPPVKGQYQPTSIKEVLEKCIKLVESRLKHKNTDLKEDIPEKLPKIRANAAELEHIFINLFNNAIDAMEGYPNKLITVSASKVKNYVQVRIQDKGIGISQDRLKSIFLPFVSEKLMERKPKGTGLGLSIAYTIIKRH
jgi:signal transduction histidine kinase